METLDEAKALELFGVPLKEVHQFLEIAGMTAKVTIVPKHLIAIIAAAPGNVDQKLLLMYLTATGIACTQAMENLDYLMEVKKQTSAPSTNETVN